MEIRALRLQFVKCSCRTQPAASSYCKFTYKNRQAKQNEKDSDSPEDSKSFSGDPERPYSRGRAYRPERYGRNTMEPVQDDADTGSVEE